MRVRPHIEPLPPDHPPPPVGQINQLQKLWDSIVENTKGDGFWIGEILLSALEQETGFNGSPKCYCAVLPNGYGKCPTCREK